MEQSILALIILAGTLLLFFIDRIPTCVSALTGALVMWIFGILTPEELFSGAANPATLMVLGMSIVGTALFETGIAKTIGDFMIAFVRKRNINEKTFMLSFYLISGILSIFFAGMIPMMIVYPVIDCMAASSEGKITRKNLYLPVAIASVLGGNLSAVGSSSMAAASGLVAESYVGRGFHLMEPFLLGLPGFLIVFFFYLTCGYRYQCKSFDYEEVPMTKMKPATQSNEPLWKKCTAGIVILGCLVGFISRLNIGAVAISAATLLMLTNCITPKKAFASTSWATVITIAASMALAKGISVSGAGKMIAETVIDVCGDMVNHPAMMATVILFLATFISNFMSNNAAVAILVPISLHIAETMGANGVIFALAVGVGANLSIATPICVSCITASMDAGYTAKHLLKVGGLANLLAFAATAAMLFVLL